MILNNSYEEAVVAFIKDITDALFAKSSYTGKKNELIEDVEVITRIAYRAQKDCTEYGYAFQDAVEEEVMEYLSLPKEASNNIHITDISKIEVGMDFDSVRQQMANTKNLILGVLPPVYLKGSYYIEDIDTKERKYYRIDEDTKTIITITSDMQEFADTNGYKVSNPNIKSEITYNEIVRCLPTEKHCSFWTNGEDILCQKEQEAEAIADFLESLGVLSVANTGYFDPEEDKANDEEDCCTGWYYVH